MGSTVQARLDAETRETLNELVRNTGMTPSEVIREGIRLVKENRQTKRRRRLIGVGCFESGIPDLASNQKYLEGLGTKSMGKGWRSPDEFADPPGK